MKTSKKIVLGITASVVVLALIAGFVFWPNSYVHRWSRRIMLSIMEKKVKEEHRHAHLRRVLLLCETDHQALLKAGREILSQIPKDRLRMNPPPDGISHLGNFKFVLPEEIPIPQAIRDIKPYVCLISYDGCLTVEMHGGWDHIKREMNHFGVNIYPEDFEEPERNFKYGDRELLPGLWYYDEGYLRNPEYDKWIEGLIEEHKGTPVPALPGG
jgi:hypothetical protein